MTHFGIVWAIEMVKVGGERWEVGGNIGCGGEVVVVNKQKLNDMFGTVTVPMLNIIIYFKIIL